MANIALIKVVLDGETMNKIKRLIAGSAFALIVLGLPAIALAQYGGYDPNGRNNGGYDPYGRNNGGYDPYGRNNGGYDPYGRNGQNGQYGNYGDTRSTIRDLKNRARDF